MRLVAFFPMVGFSLVRSAILVQPSTIPIPQHGHLVRTRMTAAPRKLGRCCRTVLAVECSNHPKTEKYVAPAEKWVNAAPTPVDLVQASSIEVGPAILLPDGRVCAIGATGRTAIYTPPNVADQPGTWVAGPTFPLDSNGNMMEAKDAPACLLPNGNVLCVAGPAGEGGSFPSPTQFFEFDGTSLSEVPNPSNSGGPPFVGRMLLVPSGQVLFAAGGPQIEVYTPTGSPDPAWRPYITNAPYFIR